MRHLKKWKLFESNKYESFDSKTIIYDDIREIFSDVIDDKCDLYINIIYRFGDKHVLILSNKNHILNYIRFSDIKDELLRLKDYLGSRWISCSVVFAGDPERIEVDINEYNYDELDNNYSEISNLAVIFNIQFMKHLKSYKLFDSNVKVNFI